jgi:hypothetical protein
MLLGLIAGFIAAKIVNKQSAGFFLDIVRESKDFSRLPLGPTFAGRRCRRRDTNRNLIRRGGWRVSVKDLATVPRLVWR